MTEEFLLLLFGLYFHRAKIRPNFSRNEETTALRAVAWVVQNDGRRQIIAFLQRFLPF
jgi:hypothetical protein